MTTNIARMSHWLDVRTKTCIMRQDMGIVRARDPFHWTRTCRIEPRGRN